MRSRLLRTSGIRRSGASALAATIGVLLLVGSAPANAADSPWYFGALKLDTGAAEGFTGEGVTIAVIDGQINPGVPSLQGTNLEIREPSFCYDAGGSLAPAATAELSPTRPTDHGTNVVSMITGTGAGYDGQPGVTGVAPGARILYYAVSTAVDETGDNECLDARGNDDDVWGDALAEAVAAKVDIISVSRGASPSAEFREAAATAMREGIILIGSLPNTSELSLTGDMPGAANGAISIQAAGADGQIQATNGKPNRNSKTDIVAPGLDFTVQGNRASGQWSEQVQADGTSLATPLTAGLLALVMEKYPEATGNQIIQSLISNTGLVPGDPQDYDANELIGYGLISLENMMADDPTKYDDVNPLIEEVQGERDLLIPSYEEIFPAGADSPEAVPDAEEPTEVSTGIPGWIWIVVAGAGALVVIAAIVIVLVMRKRRPATRPSN